MRLLINHIEFAHFNAIEVQLNFECVASAFTVEVYFDPSIKEHKEAMRPDAFHECMLYNDAGELLITGTIIRTSFGSSAGKAWVKLSGYSKTGVLEDCEVPLSCYPLQTNALSLRQICERICSPFGISVVVDPAVAAEADARITKSTAQESQSAKAYLAELCSHRQIVLSHTNNGELLLTKANTNAQVVYSFAPNDSKAYSLSLDFNGQGMHSHLGAIRQASKSKGGGTVGQSTIANPYVTTVFRSAVKRQRSGDMVDDTNATVRSILSDELKGIALKIEQHGFYLNGVFVRPGMMVSVHNPELYLYAPTLFFVEGVTYKGSVSGETAVLNCYVPEVYNQAEPKNIFA